MIKLKDNASITENFGCTLQAAQHDEHIDPLTGIDIYFGSAC